MRLDVYFPEENNTGLLQGPFHPHSPLHTLKDIDIPLKINRCNAKTK